MMCVSITGPPATLHPQYWLLYPRAAGPAAPGSHANTAAARYKDKYFQFQYHSELKIISICEYFNFYMEMWIADFDFIPPI